jgi:DNA-binding NarL/FixJ family response regulator
MKVYLADDHGLFRSGLKFLLTGLDPSLTIVEAATLGELQAQDIAEFDLVLIDLVFGGHDALPLISSLVERAGAARIVVISGDDSPERVRKCIDAGAMGFLPKSEDQGRLLPALRLVLSGGIYLPAKAIKHFSSGQEPAASLPKAPEPHRIQRLLSERQWQILQRAVNGTPNKIIARELFIAEGTVKAHLSKIYQTIGVHNRTEAVYVLASESTSIMEQGGK